MEWWQSVTGSKISCSLAAIQFIYSKIEELSRSTGGLLHKNRAQNAPRFGRYPGFSAMLPPEAEMWTDQELDVGELNGTSCMEPNEFEEVLFFFEEIRFC